MERTSEPDLMETAEQARAYALADFEEPHRRFVELFLYAFPGYEPAGPVLDLGCGPGDISMRFARQFPGSSVVGVDGSEAMLGEGRRILEQKPEIAARVSFHLCRLPSTDIPRARYAAVISNSLLHHLQEPQTLWQTIKECGTPGVPVFVMDLMRPETAQRAGILLEKYMPDEPPVLKRDFLASLHAAYEVEEVIGQLELAGLDCLGVEAVGDRHLLVSGLMP